MPLDAMQAENFVAPILAWYKSHGRKDLPWQIDRDPYAIWVSEIMLQQTQVVTVIPYYRRFMQRFPNLLELAKAELDEVLHHWSGLGYYARARNLHAAARLVQDRYDGRLPQSLETLQQLPGIGRSTAGAILSFAWGHPNTILDGNVKRVLARHFAIEGWPGRTPVLKRLWELAEALTPSHETAAYNQAMMDLGSLICQRGMPNCVACPVQSSCQAHTLGREREYPAPKPPKALPVKRGYLLVLRDRAGAVLLERRPPAGIWGGLWSFPECSLEDDPLEWCQEKLAYVPAGLLSLPTRRHSFSHFHYDMTPVQIHVNNPSNRVMDVKDRVWYKLNQPDVRGLAAPVQRILDELQACPVGVSE